MSSTTVSESLGDRSGPGAGIYLAFAPWVLFSLVAQHSTLKLAATAALLASILITLPSFRVRRPKVLEVGAVLAFAGFTFVAFAADPATSEWVARYARAIAAAVLSLIAFGSLLVIPFTEQYARESVAQELWSSRQFKQVNRRLTRMWAVVFAVMVPCHIVAGAIDTHRANVIFNWAIPVALIVWAAKRTTAVSEATEAPAL